MWPALRPHLIAHAQLGPTHVIDCPSYSYCSKFLATGCLHTVEPLLTTTPDRRPPAYYGHSPWVQNASSFTTMLQKPLIYGHLSTPYNGHFSWPQTMPINALYSLARATPVWKNRGLVTALHTTSSDGMQLADTVGRAAVPQLTQV